MSAWQQIGRAGRGWNKDAFILFFATNDPIDNFYGSNLETFLNSPFDELVVDPANEELIKHHLPSLIEETDGILQPDDEKILGSAFYNAARKTRAKPPKGRATPQYPLSKILRGGFGQTYKLKKGSNDLGATIPEYRRFREAYTGAIITFYGKKYRVHSREEGAIVLDDARPFHKTVPNFHTELYEMQAKIEGLAYGGIEIYHGQINIVMYFNGYKLVDERNNEVIGTGGDPEALPHQNNLHSFWVVFPRSKLASDGIGALEHLVRIGAKFVIPADHFDTNSYSRVGKSPDFPTAYLYENYSGGIGIAKRMFEKWPNALRKGIEIAEKCGCNRGCQNCIEPAKSYNISNSRINKVRGIELAKTLLVAAQKGPDHEYQDGVLVPFG